MWWIIVVSVLVGLGRFLIPGHDLSWAGTYEAFAHIWVGALLVFVFGRKPPNTLTTERSDLALFSLVILTVLEGVMFFLFKRGSQP